MARAVSGLRARIGTSLSLRLRPSALTSLLTNEALRKRHEISTAVRSPEDPSVVENSNDPAPKSATKRFYPIAGFPIGRLAQAIDDFHHALAVQNARNIMRNRRGNLAKSTRG